MFGQKTGGYNSILGLYGINKSDLKWKKNLLKWICYRNIDRDMSMEIWFGKPEYA